MAWHAAVGAAAVGLSLLLGAACGGDEEEPPPPPEPETPTARVEITVEYPGAREESIVAAVHFWVLSLDEDSDVTCAKLIGGDVDPYDLSMARLAEGASTDTSEVLASDDVLLGPALAHVEATDYVGHPEFAGCAEIDVVQEVTTVTITLQKAGVFDCTDPETEDGAPCDDGLICTVGETCDGTSCEPAAPRDCTHVADQCNAESCDEELGCVATPIADNTPCDDGLYCTEGDVCQSGECVGTARDCLDGADPCQILLQCDEANDECDLGWATTGTACDDGDFCNGTETCTNYGSYALCTNSTGNPCPGADGDDDCSETCDEATDSCTANDPSYSACDDGNFCNGPDECISGTCTNSTVVDPCAAYVGDADDDCSESCDEATDTCTANDPDSSACDDGYFCNGTETCTSGVCGSSTNPPCDGEDGDIDCSETCDDVADNCDGNDSNGAACDDGNPATTTDLCDGSGNCVGT